MRLVNDLTTKGVTAMETVSVTELVVSSLAASDALVKLLIDKGLITEREFLKRIAEERATYQHLLNPSRVDA